MIPKKKGQEENTNPNSGSTPASRKLHVFAVLGATWIAAFLVSLDTTAVAVALPTLAVDFGVGTGKVSWASLSYMLVIVALTLFAGPAIERFGPNCTLAGSLVAFALASLAASLSSGLWILVGCRAAQGVGASIMFVIGPAMIRTLLPEQQQARAFAVFSTAPMAGLAFGPAIGGELTHRFGWNSVFLPNLPFATIALILVSAIRTHPNLTHKELVRNRGSHVPSLMTAMMVPLALASLVLALNQRDEWGWSSLPILSLMTTFLTATTAAVISERRTKSPLLDRRVIMAKDFATSVTLFFLLLAVFGGLTFLMPFYMEWLLKLETDNMGHILAVQPIATISVSILSGVMFGAVARRTLCLAGIVLVSAGTATYAVSTTTPSILIAIGGLLLMGTGAGLYYPALMQLSLTNVPTELAASASSVQTTIRVLAQMLGLVIFETLFSEFYPMSHDAARAANATGHELETMKSAFEMVFWSATLFVALAILPALRLSKTATAPNSPTKTRIKRTT